VKLHTSLVRLDDFLMAWAMAGLGLGLSLRSFIRIGPQALAVGALGSLFISLFSAGTLFLGQG
jgi:uncharacterized membrane protein YadS